MKLYTSAAAQFDNLGDLVLRRVLLDRVRPLVEQVHVFLGDAPADYVSALGLQPNDVTYRSYARWESGLLRGGRGRFAGLRAR